jgi:hypothetical protein
MVRYYLRCRAVRVLDSSRHLQGLTIPPEDFD